MGSPLALKGADRLFLDGVKVLDLSRLLPGGVASAMLTAMGADVVKVEEPSTGDYMRSMPPFGPRGNVYFEHLHRGQRSLAVDLRDARGRDILTALAVDSDVLLESFRPGVMDRLGLGQAALARVNPRLVCCSLTAYGQPADGTGRSSDGSGRPSGAAPTDEPDRLAAGHDLNIMALSGLLSYLTDGAGRVLPPPLQLADVAAGGMLAVTAILGALVERSRTGRGRRLDVAMLDGLRVLGVLQRVEGAATGRYPAHQDLPLAGNLACYNVYNTADGGAMALGALEPKFWAAFCAAVGRPDWVARQFEPPPSQATLIGEVAALFALRPRAAWEEFGRRADSCLAPVLSPAEAVVHPLTHGRPLDDAFPVAMDPAGGAEAAASTTPGGLADAPAVAPALGHDTAPVLRALGYSDETIKALADVGVVRLGEERT